MPAGVLKAVVRVQRSGVCAGHWLADLLDEAVAHCDGCEELALVASEVRPVAAGELAVAAVLGTEDGGFAIAKRLAEAGLEAGFGRIVKDKHWLFPSLQKVQAKR